MNHIPTEEEIEEMLRRNQSPIPMISYDLPEGYILVRARYHDSTYLPEFVKDIYYPPEPKKINLGRANNWGQQVFYGMLATGGIGPRLAACQEVGDEHHWPPTFTVSRWRVKKTLPDVASVIMHESQTKGNAFAHLTYVRNFQYLSELPTSIIAKSKAHLEYIGQQFARKITDCRYELTVRFANYLFDNGMNAIIYPSVSKDYDSICIALPADVADEYLEPVGGGLTQIHRTAPDLADECCYQTFTVKGERLIWSPYDDQGPERHPFDENSIIPHRLNPCKALREQLGIQL
ncbi:MAG: hypothetical protein JNM62_10140 [Flavobacteriales bacterium]|nr:hypothetical protein [Flavobacteriales bacterium]